MTIFFERKYITYICESDSEREKELFYVQELLNQRAAGIIIAPSGQNTPYLQGVTKNYKNMIAIDRQEDIGCDMVLGKSQGQCISSYLMASEKLSHAAVS